MSIGTFGKGSVIFEASDSVLGVVSALLESLPGNPVSGVYPIDSLGRTVGISEVFETF